MSDFARRYVYEAGITPLGGQDVLPMDTFSREYFHASFHVDLVSGSMSVQPEYSMDDMEGDPSTFRWFPYGGVLTDTTLVEINKPVCGLRLNIGSFTGEIHVTALQGITS